MSSELDQLKAKHEELRLQKRAVDRETEDTRTKTIEEKRVAEAEIEKLQLDLESLKEETAALTDKNKNLETTITSLKEQHQQKKKKQIFLVEFLPGGFPDVDTVSVEFQQLLPGRLDLLLPGLLLELEFSEDVVQLVHLGFVDLFDVVPLVFVELHLFLELLDL